MDDSIGCAIWFAARGLGRVTFDTASSLDDYQSPAKVRNNYFSPTTSHLGPLFIELLKKKVLFDTFLLKMSRIPVTNRTYDMVVWLVF